MTENSTTRSRTIMVVDDDQRNVRLMESILRSNEYRVVKAYDGDEALRLVETEPPDLILLDVMMPKVSGLELCRTLRDRHATRLLPIIMITALNALEDKVRALEIGADDFLSKPINKTELLAKVRSILRVKALQDENERQKVLLEETNSRLLSMQTFKESMTQMVVHDLKNPLAGIMGNIQLMQMQRFGAGQERFEELMSRTIESGRQMTRMILNILEIGKLEEQKMPLKIEPVSIHRIVSDNLADTTSLCARDGIQVHNLLEESLPPVEADRGLIDRIVANLLNNAFKHTPEGGQVRVNAAVEGGEIVLSIGDTGAGIPTDLQLRIFEKFVGGDADNDGRMLHDSGLGLTFCRLAVERHGGRIWLQSRAGVGTTAFVALPLKASRTAASGLPGGGVGGARAA